MTANGMESWLSYETLLGFLNENMVNKGFKAALWMSMLLTISRLQPQIIKQEKQKQGDRNLYLQ